MNRRLYLKTLALSIVFLFVGVSLSSAISVDTKSTTSDNQSEECRECNEVSDADIVKVERLLDRVEIYSKLLMALSKYNSELREISEELSNEIAYLKEELTNNRFPIICDILRGVNYILWGIYETHKDNILGFIMIDLIVIPVYNIYYILCEWIP